MNASPAMPAPRDRAAHDYLAAHWPAHLARVQAFLRQPSVSAQDRGVREAAGLLAGWLAEAGAQVALHGDPARPIVYGEWAVGAPRTLLLYGMYDVQPVDGQVWSVPPFGAAIRTHRIGGPALIARGACNSKGPLLACLNAIEALRATGGLPVNLKWTIEGDEEIGSPQLPGFYRAERARLQADAAYEPFWAQPAPDAPPQLTLGTKGITGIQFVSRAGAWGGSERVRHSSDGAWLGSPAWRLVQALATLVDADQQLAVDGIPALGPMDPDDAALLERLAAHFDPQEQLSRIRAARFKRADYGAFELLRQQQFAPALNINGLESGYAGPGSHTIIPTVARAHTDLRVPAGLAVADLLAALRRHLDARGFADIELIAETGYPGARAPYSAPVVQAMVAAYRALGHEPVIRPIEPSATPYYLFTEVLGLPFAWGGLGCAGGSHGPDEWASLAGLRDLARFVVTFLDTFGAA